MFLTCPATCTRIAIDYDKIDFWGVSQILKAVMRHDGRMKERVETRVKWLTARLAEFEKFFTFLKVLKCVPTSTRKLLRNVVYRLYRSLLFCETVRRRHLLHIQSQKNELFDFTSSKFVATSTTIVLRALFTA